MKFRKTAISTPAAMAFAIVLAIAAGAVVYAFTSHPGSTTSPNQSSTAVNTNAAPNPILGVTVQVTNTLTGASITPTNPVYNFFSCSGSVGSTWPPSSIYGDSATISSLAAGTQKTTTLTSKDFACGFGILLVYTGDAQYPDTSKVLSGGNGVPISQYAWINGLTQGRKDLAVKLDYSALGSPNYQNSNQNLQFVFTNSEFAQTTLASVTLTDAYSTHEILSVGTAANTVTTVKWTLGVITSGDGAAISQIIGFTNDSTSAPLINAWGTMAFGDNLPFNLPQGVSSGNVVTSGAAISGITFGNAKSQGYASSTRTYQYQYYPGNLNLDSTQLANSFMVDNPAQSVGDTTISLPITTSLTATHPDVNVSLSIVLIAGDGTTTTLTSNPVDISATAT